MKNPTMTVEISSGHPAINGRYLYAMLALPASGYEIRDAIQRVRAVGREDCTLDMTILDCPYLPELTDTRLDAPTIDELNFFAKHLSGLDESEQRLLKGVFQAFQKNKDNIIGMKELINLTFGLESVIVASNIHNDEELGQLVIDSDMNEDVSSVPEDARYLLDKSRIGKFQRENDGGVYIDGYYIATESYEMSEIYDGEHLPEEPESNPYIFRLLVAEAPVNDSTETIGCAEWIELPIALDGADRFAVKHGKGRIEDCVYYDFESVIPQIHRETFRNMMNFRLLNELANHFLAMEESEQIKFKAVLEGEQINTFQDAVDAACHLHEYELAYFCEDKDDFAREYLAYHSGLDVRLLEHVYAPQMGAEILERLGGKETSYGFISARGQSLFALVPFEKPTEKETVSSEEMGIKHIALKELKQMTDHEGLILQGCGGNLQDWADGINNALTEAGILYDGDTFKDVSVFEHNGITNLLFNMDNVKVNVGALAMWRIQTHSQFGGTWISDYLSNQFGINRDDTQPSNQQTESDSQIMDPDYPIEDIGMSL